jgi:DivIVA domain-containing protein
MEEAQDIRNRTFSFGAHGYDQDEVDRYLRELADRVDSADVDWHAEVERLGGQAFGVVSLGYWRPDVDSWPSFGRGWSSAPASVR